MEHVHVFMMYYRVTRSLLFFGWPFWWPFSAVSVPSYVSYQELDVVKWCCVVLCDGAGACMHFQYEV